MRIIILILLLPSMSYGISADQCFLEGEINGKRTVLKYVEGKNGQDGYSSKAIKSYAFCQFSEPAKNSPFPSFLNCSEKEGMKAVVTYELKERTRKDGSLEGYYLCKNGCKNNISNQLYNHCYDDGS